MRYTTFLKMKFITCFQTSLHQRVLPTAATSPRREPGLTPSCPSCPRCDPVHGHTHRKATTQREPQVLQETPPSHTLQQISRKHSIDWRKPAVSSSGGNAGLHICTLKTNPSGNLIFSPYYLLLCCLILLVCNSVTCLNHKSRFFFPPPVLFLFFIIIYLREYTQFVHSGKNQSY